MRPCRLGVAFSSVPVDSNLHISRPGRRVRGPGLQERALGTCRPRALTRRTVGVSIDV